MPSAKAISSTITAAIPGAGAITGDPHVFVDTVKALGEADMYHLSWSRGTIAENWSGGIAIVKEVNPNARATQIACANPRLALAYALQRFWINTPPTISCAATAHVEPGTIIGQQGNSIEWDARCQRYVRVPPQAGVVIGADTYIGAFCTVVRGVLNDTVIGRGVEICNHVNVGHGVHIGDHSIVAPFVALGGSSRIGERVTLWQGACVRNGVCIGPRAVIGQGANVITDVPAGEVWAGNPARRIS